MNSGPAGPAGINEINQSDLYIVEGNTVSINGSNAQASSSASCDEGDTGIGGNYVVTSCGNSCWRIIHRSTRGYSR